MTSDDFVEGQAKGWRSDVTLQQFKRFKVPNSGFGSSFMVRLVNLVFDTKIHMQVTPKKTENVIEVLLSYERHHLDEVEKLIIDIEMLYSDLVRG